MDILWRDLLLVYNYRLSEVMTVSPGELTGTKGEHHETVKTTVNMTKRTQYKRPRRGRAAPAQGAGRPESDATPTRGYFIHTPNRPGEYIQLYFNMYNSW